MAMVSIVGGRAGGKTIALGLLHESLVAYANRNKKDFQFESNLTSPGYLYDNVLKPLRTGQFPPSTEPGSWEEVKLHLRFRTLLGWKEVVINTFATSTFEDVVRQFLPRTYDTMKYDIEKLKPENMAYFRSGLIMKQDDETGEARIGTPLTFSIHEYVRLAKWLSEI